MAAVVKVIQRRTVVKVRGAGPRGPAAPGIFPPTGTGFRHVISGVEDATAKLVAASDIGDAELAALAGLTSAANKLPYFTGSGTAAVADLSAFIRTVLDDADAATARTTLGAETAGAAVAAQAASQPLDSDLTAIAALATTSFGRAFLALADAAAARTAISAEVAGAAAAAQAASQPLDSDLTAIAALATTAYGRAFLVIADAAAGRTALGLGTAATQSTAAFDAAGAAAAAQAASQPLDSDLTAIAALTTTAYGRSVLETASAAALRTLAGLVIGTDVQAYDADLAAIAALTTTSFGRSFLPLADAAAGRTLLALGSAATAATGDFDAAGAAAAAQAASQPLDSDLTAIAALTTTAYGRALLALADATALATLVDPFFLTPTEGNAAYQPLDSDLTAIAALSTTSYGRSLLTLAAASNLAAQVVGGTDTQVQFNDSGALGGDADLTWDKTNNILSVGDTTAGFVQGKGNLAGAGGPLVLKGGDSAGAGDAGADLYLTGGTPTDGAGGGLQIVASPGVGTDRGGGDITAQGGASTGSAAGGRVHFDGGPSTDTGDGGELQFQGGPALGTDGSGGNVKFVAGKAAGGGTPGAMELSHADPTLVPELRFKEALANGTNYVGFKSPLALSANTVWQLPATDGTAGQALVTNGSAVLGFSPVQPLDSDLTAIAALSTTSFGRGLLALADAAAGRTAFGLGTASIHAHGDYDAAGAAAAAQAASQPLDSDLTAVAALTTTSYGRSLLEAANAAALRTLAGTVIGTDVQAQDAELAALAGLTSAADKVPYFTGSGTAAVGTLTAAGRALIDDADAAAQRTTLGLAALAIKATVGTADIDNDAVTYAKIQNVSATDKVLGRSTSGAGDVEEIACTAAGRALIAAATAAAQRVTLGVAPASTGSFFV